VAYQPNDGRPPSEPTDRKVHVICFGGFDSKKRGDAPWPVGQPTVWAISSPPHPYQIKEWELA